jgi:SAM-dependent methyltransferase
MHSTAKSNAELFFQTYVFRPEQTKILEIGSRDVNGALREVAPKTLDYVGVDIDEGSGVDIVLADPYSFPFDSETFDVVVTSSCFEHTELFWVTYLEALRVVKPHGLLYINAPSNGPFHQFPVDCWRFYPDAGRALTNWARRSGFRPSLLESYIGRQRDDLWNDFVAVFIKDIACKNLYPKRIIEALKDFENGVLNEDEQIVQLNQSSEDLRQISELATQVTRLQTELSQKDAALVEQRRHLALQQIERDAARAALASAKAAAAECISRLNADRDHLARYLDRTFRRPWRPIRYYVNYNLLRALSAVSALFSERMARRFNRSAERRSPRRFETYATGSAHSRRSC